MDYTSITELPGSLLNRDQMHRFVHRYTLAVEQAQAIGASARVLEVACGAGSGLGYLQSHARQVIGLDYTEPVLRHAQTHYGARVPLVQADAQALPFADGSFDLILCFEAIYYLPDYRRFLAESCRVLAAGGMLLLCQSNPDWPDFVPGALTTHYPLVPELASALQAAGFDEIHFYGALPTAAATPRQRLVNRVRRFVLQLGLLPTEGRVATWLKRFGYGVLVPLPAELNGDMVASYADEFALARVDSDRPDRVHRVLFAESRRGTRPAGR